MIILQANDFQYQSASFVTAEQEAMSHLFGLHERIMQTKSLLRYLKKNLCAHACLEKSEGKLAQLQEEVRTWHAIRVQATQSRQILSHLREEMTLWREIRRKTVPPRQMLSIDKEAAGVLCPLDGSAGCHILNQFHLSGPQEQPCELEQA